ncbi:hypothetical protein GCM10010230_24570 [Streptomyces narbonensis]|nr:hypothetical protein GCM10010230_24570 [Streptomyces narbonensis]
MRVATKSVETPSWIFPQVTGATRAAAGAGQAARHDRSAGADDGTPTCAALRHGSSDRVSARARPPGRRRHEAQRYEAVHVPFEFRDVVALGDQPSWMGSERRGQGARMDRARTVLGFASDGESSVSPAFAPLVRVRKA